MGKRGPKKGANLIPFDENTLGQLQGLAEIQATAEECAGVLKMSTDTITRRLKERGYKNLAEFLEIHRQNGKASLRRLQWEHAQEGNTQMLLHLGRNWLNQDKQDTNINIDVQIDRVERVIVHHDSKQVENEQPMKVINGNAAN